MSVSASVVNQKFDEEVDALRIVIPAKVGIQNPGDSLDSGSRPLDGLGRNDGRTYVTNFRLRTLADESFFALSFESFADFETFTKITAAADASDNIRGGPFREEIGVQECDGLAAQETVAATHGRVR